MKDYLKRMTSRARKLIAAAYDRAFAQNKKGLVKWGLIALVTVAVLVAVGLFIGFLAFCMLIPGMILGFFLWFPWTYLEQGARFFPELDPIWHQLTFWDLTWASSAVIWTSRLIRSRRTRPADSIKAADGSWELRKDRK